MKEEKIFIWRLILDRLATTIIPHQVYESVAEKLLKTESEEYFETFDLAHIAMIEVINNILISSQKALANAQTFTQEKAIERYIFID